MGAICIIVLMATVVVSITTGIIVSQKKQKGEANLKNKNPLLPGEPKKGWGPVILIRRHRSGKREIQVGQMGSKHKVVIRDVDSGRFFLRSIANLERLSFPTQPTQ